MAGEACGCQTRRNGHILGNKYLPTYKRPRMNDDKRRLSNPLALAVLVLLYERPMHPYEMACTLRERHKEASIKLNYGSLYTIIEQLQREQFIFPRETLREGKRPEKTVYELTADGKTELINWMRELVSDPVKEFPQFEAALSLIPALPPDEVVALLEIRVNLLKKELEGHSEEGRLCKTVKLPRLFSLEREYHNEMARAECRFSEQLLADIKRDVGGLKSSWIELRKSIARGRLRCSKARLLSGAKEKA
jgi:DNA-binding PadR family transcriptional regulator